MSDGDLGGPAQQTRLDDPEQGGAATREYEAGVAAVCRPASVPTKHRKAIRDRGHRNAARPDTQGSCSLRRKSADHMVREEMEKLAKNPLGPFGRVRTGIRPGTIWKSLLLAGKLLWIRGWNFFHSGDSRALDWLRPASNTRSTHPGVPPTSPTSLDDSNANPGRQEIKQLEDVHRSFHRCGCFCGQTGPWEEWPSIDATRTSKRPMGGLPRHHEGRCLRSQLGHLALPTGA